MYINETIKNLYDKLLETKIIYLLIGCAILISYYILYLFRAIDNTVLMSWYSVFLFTNITINELILILSIVILISFIISRINIPKSYQNEKFHVFFLFIFGLIIGSLFWNIPEINPDAARYINQAKYLEEFGIWRFFNDWGHDLFAWRDYPSIPFFYGIIFKYLGEYREYIQLFNTILFSLTPILTYMIAKRLWNAEIGFYSGLLLLSFPYLLSQVPLMLVDIPLMFLTILSAVLILKIFDNKYYSIPASLVIFFTVYAKMTSVIMIIPAFSILIINYRSVYKNRKRWILTFILSFVSIILLSYWKRDVFIEQIRFILNDTGPIFYESKLNYLFQLGPIIIFLALISIIIVYLKKDKNYIILISWIIIPFLLFYGRIRYMIPIFPFIAIATSISIYRISNENIKNFLISSLVLTSIAFSIYAYIPFEEGYVDKNIKNAAEYTNAIDISKIEIFLDFSDKHKTNPEALVTIFDLYSHKKIIYYTENMFHSPVYDGSDNYIIPPSFYSEDRSISSKNDQIIVIISNKEQQNTTFQTHLVNHVLIKTFEEGTISILDPSLVRVYVPRNSN